MEHLSMRVELKSAMEESGGQFVAIHGTIGKQELFVPNLDIKFKVLKSIYVVQQQIFTLL